MKITRINITDDLSALTMKQTDSDGTTINYECQTELNFKEFDIHVFLKGEAEYEITRPFDSPPESEEMTRDISCFELTSYTKDGEEIPEEEMELDFDEEKVITNINLDN